MNKFIVIETTYPKLEEAEKMAEILLNEKLAACIHISATESRYIWQEKLEKTPEIALKIKTSAKLFSKIEKIIKESHSYQLPQIIATEIKFGNKYYLDWIKNLVKKK